jgi:hypothetical protein
VPGWHAKDIEPVRRAGGACVRPLSKDVFVMRRAMGLLPSPDCGEGGMITPVSAAAHSAAGPYALAFAQRSGRSAFFQSGMAEIFFSRSSTSASRCRPGTRSVGKPGSTWTRASALAKVSRDRV